MADIQPNTLTKDQPTGLHHPKFGDIGSKLRSQVSKDFGTLLGQCTDRIYNKITKNIRNVHMDNTLDRMQYRSENDNIAMLLSFVTIPNYKYCVPFQDLKVSLEERLAHEFCATKLGFDVFLEYNHINTDLKCAVYATWR